ncbi:3-phosphoshikimate 1-carboxyvinyltransferase [Streptomyces sp. NPDC059894]|uniref:3-phosphoshikimate 1-carboxyvinyltransferase n=1 Tax=unclassified Streptomyces TaxID=2593676 RepID=UPI0036476BFB
MRTEVPQAREGALVARIPGSKSLTNRALLLAAAAPGTSRVRAPLVSDDTVAFGAALSGLGARVDTGGPEGRWEVTGTGGGPVGPARVWCADAGTAARFLPPFAAAGRGTFDFDGSDQLRARPQGGLIDALTRLGARIRAEDRGRLPFRLEAAGLDGGEIAVDASMSSQYVSGLLMAAPLTRDGLVLDVRSPVSRPYLDMTLGLMRHFGARFQVDTTADRVEVRPGGYRAADVVVEPDASTASYFFAAAAATGRTVTVPGLGQASSQGDLGFVRVLERFGARVTIGAQATTVTGAGALRGGFDVDMGDVSDTFMTLAAIAPLADAPVTIRGIGHARLKESDRIAAVAANLRACGIRSEEGRDWITVRPGAPRPARIECRRDHRIAMSFAVLALASGVPLELDDPACVSKTFPGFHAELHRLFPAYAIPASTEEHR